MTVIEREVLVSIIIPCMLLTIGVLIGEKIQDKAAQAPQLKQLWYLRSSIASSPTDAGFTQHMEVRI